MAQSVTVKDGAKVLKPRIYEQSRAIPTKSGERVRLSVYTNDIRSLVIGVPTGVPGSTVYRKAKRFGTGCGQKRCTKWKTFIPRTGEECYDLRLYGKAGNGTLVDHQTVCEPFRNGNV
ncbi:MAG: hypothetical protein ACSLFD_08770 [Solirubrobacterales bacterium]